jgi:type IV secretion system protein VirD4
MDQSPNLPPAYRSIVEEAKGLISPAGGGAWLKPAEVPRTVFAPSGPYPLYIGTFPDGSMLSYSGDGSMVTIAPPGSGKTQCNVFPNLLTWNGPAIVLDISGDIYEHTAAWRAAHMGPVYKFSPLDPEDSHSTRTWTRSSETLRRTDSRTSGKRRWNLSEVGKMRGWRT